MPARIEDLMSKATGLARAAGAGRALESQLAQVLAHLKKHKNPAATLALVEALPKSPFALRSKQTRQQLTALAAGTRSALAGVTGWQEAATIVGWARRLLASQRPRTPSGHHPHHRP